METLIIYSLIFFISILIIVVYLKKLKNTSKKVVSKVEKAKEAGFFEPVSLYPRIDDGRCIGSAACVKACPEKDILGIMNGKATLINASQCIGHGACFHACPVEAISLVIGTEKRGVELPHVGPDFQSNVPGIYIAGELGGMGLIRNSMEQGIQAVENIIKSGLRKDMTKHDLVIIGAGPAGISAALTAKKYNLDFLLLEQDSLGGTVFTFPRSKIVMTSPIILPVHGKIQFFNTSKSELLNLWREILLKQNIEVKENTRVTDIIGQGAYFEVVTSGKESYSTEKVLLAIGRRGTPRKLNIPGEDTEKVAYKLMEPENIAGKKIIVVGGGDSAVEAALALLERNEVTLSYRNEAFNRIKPANHQKILEARQNNRLSILFGSNLIEIGTAFVSLKTGTDQVTLDNDLVYIFAGGELPTEFLRRTGIKITKRFGHTLKKYK